jgi:hypothetical protein
VRGPIGARGASARTALALWSLTCCLALLTHYFAVFIVIAELGAMLWVLRADRTHLRSVLLATIPVVVVGLALVPLAHAQEADGRTSWIAAAPIASRFGEVLREVFSANTSLISSNSAGPGGVWAALGIAGVAIGLAAAVVTRGARQNAPRAARQNARRARQNATAGRLAAIGIAAIAIPLVLSFTALDYFKDRNLIAAWAPLVGAFAAGIALARPRLGLPALALILAAGIAVDVRVQTTPSLQRTNWREIARIIASPRVPQAVFVDPAYDEAALAYYGQRLAAMPVGARVRGVTTIGTGDHIDQSLPPGYTATLRRTVSGLTVLRLRTTKALTMTRAAIARAGRQIFLELTPAGNRWIATYLADAVAWTRALAKLGPDLKARTTLAHAPQQAAELGRPPEGVPPSLATRLRTAATRAAAAAHDPTPANRAALRRALAPAPSG